jgi:hypothetical protein
MIQRLREVVPGKLYRGSAPSPKDVQNLQKEFGIKKIVSLDEASGERISRVCKLLGINQVKVYIDGDRSSLRNFLHHNIKKLLIDGGPTYVHCQAGKDRTGLAVALYKCKYMGVDPEKAIEEAKSLGFGVGVNPIIVKTFEKLIRSCKPVKDENNADIVSNEREYVGDNRDSFLDEGHQGSFAPYLNVTKQDPMDALYNFIMDQSPTRDNYKSYKSIKPHDPEEEDVVPMVGVFDNDAGGRGFGPVENGGGFIYD